MVAENPKGIGQRHFLAFWLFTGLAIEFGSRFSIFVTIVAMVGSNKTEIVNFHATPNGTCPLPSFVNNTESIEKLTSGEFDWDHATQGYILSAFFYSYLLIMFPGGLLIRKFGVRLLMGISIGGSSIFSLLVPFCARIDPLALVFIRILQGLFAGVVYPGSYHIVASWVPEQEKTVFVSIALFCSSSVGTILSAQLSGFLCEHGFAGGWPSVFYIFGIAGFIWSIGWFICVRDTPRKHPWISEEEKLYIEENCHVVNDNKSFSDVPWNQIFASGPFWGIVAAHYCYNWAFYTTFASLPTYFKDVLHLPPTMNGLAISLPHIVLTVSMSTTGVLADILRKCLSTRAVRIMYYDFGLIVTVTFFMLIIYAECNLILIGIFLSISFFGMGISLNGFGVNHLDIAPRYASIMMAFSNTIGNIPGLASPIVTGFIVNEESNFDSWKKVFLINAGVCSIGVLMFSLLAHGDVQSWAHKKGEVDADKEENEQALQHDEYRSRTSTLNVAVVEPLLEH